MAQVYTGTDATGNTLASGDEVVTRTACSIGVVTVPTATGSLILTPYNGKVQQSSSQVRVITGSTAAGATPTLCRIGLYQVSTILGILTGTLVASTPNDTTLFAAANTAYTKAWSVAPAIQPGQRYAVGTLVVTAAAAPTFLGQQFMNAAEAALSPRLAGTLTAQADLPASWVDSALATSAFQQYAVILP